MSFKKLDTSIRNCDEFKLGASQRQRHSAKRKLLLGIGAGGLIVTATPARWSQPIVDSVLLPLHAQTSCTPNTQVGGPLIGNASGATNCTDACIAEADSLNVQLCGVSESSDSDDAIICTCDIDLL